MTAFSILALAIGVLVLALRLTALERTLDQRIADRAWDGCAQRMAAAASEHIERRKLARAKVSKDD